MLAVLALRRPAPLLYCGLPRRFVGRRRLCLPSPRGVRRSRDASVPDEYEKRTAETPPPLRLTGDLFFGFGFDFGFDCGFDFDFGFDCGFGCGGCGSCCRCRGLI